MTAIDALIYCIGFVDDRIEDGDHRSQTAYDVNGDPHWVAWSAVNRSFCSPRLCSESIAPFAAYLQPYRVS